jgi:plastocyanin
MTAITLALVLAAQQAVDVSGAVKVSSGREAGLAAVWLDGDEKAKPLTNAKIDQHHRMFDPHVLVVTQGTTVAFPNNDTVTHNVFVEFNPKSKFDLHSYPRGVTKYVKFDKLGLVVLLCNMHSEMGAFIMVVDTPYYTVADPKGKFSIQNVKPGKYKLHAWHESGQVYEQDVTVGPRTTFEISLARKKR